MRIQTPSNRRITVNGSTCDLIWEPDFTARWQERYDKTQRFVDSEVIRYCAPFTPFDSSFLQKSATLGTVIGSGEVVWNAPYGKYLYYGKVMVSPTTGSPWAQRGERKVLTERNLQFNGAPKRGAFWFERMKAVHKKDIIDGAREIAGGGA